MSFVALSSIPLGRRCYWKDDLRISKVEKRGGRKLCVLGSVASSSLQSSQKEVRIGVLGASGYTGSEIIRLLANHPHFGITLMTADRKAGQSIGSVFPHLITQGRSPYTRTHHHILISGPLGFCPLQKRRSIFPCMVNMTEGQFDGPGKLNLDHTMDVIGKVWDCFPQPVKNFPWMKTLENYIQLILDLVCAVTKYLCVPLLVVSSLSEMSYCAHERKMVLIPIPLLVGIAVAGVLRDAALELSPLLKEAEVPWHLIAIAIFFTLLKLPGPYYPYWGRIFIPHFANGGLLRTLWSAFQWYRRPRETPETTLQQIDESF